MDLSEKVVVADVGGTKVQLYLLDLCTKNKEPVKKKKYYCKEYGSLKEILHNFGVEKGAYLVVGAAGRVALGKCIMTNLSWIIDEEELEREFGLKKAFVVNDVELLGKGIPFLQESDLLVLQKGKKSNSKIKSVLTVGTGLGEGIIFDKEAIATEGGHCDFAATTKEEKALLEKMEEQFGHVSYERVLSGEGVESIYEFFAGEKKTAAEVFEGKDGLKSVIFFLQVLGKEAANLALKSLSLGGVYLSGGVLTNNFLAIQREEFLEAFLEKGRFQSLLKEVPVYLIRGDKGIVEGAYQMVVAS